MVFYKIGYSIDPRKILNYKSEKGKDLLESLIESIIEKFSGCRVIKLEKKFNAFGIVLCRNEATTEDNIKNISDSVISTFEIGDVTTVVEQVNVDNILKSHQLSAADREYLLDFSENIPGEATEAEDCECEEAAEPVSEKPQKKDAFDAVKELVAMEPLKEWAEEMKGFKKLSVSHEILQKTILSMSYLVSVNSGNGCSTVFKAMGDVVANILNKDSTEIHEIDVEPDKDAKESYNIDKIIRDITYIADESPILRVFVLNIEKFQNNKFMGEWIKLLSAIKSSQKFLTIFNVRYLEKTAISDFHTQIDDIISNRVLVIQPFDNNDYSQFFKLYFEKIGLAVSDEVLSRVPEIIASEHCDGRFYGVATINKVCDEIMYEKLKAAALGNNDLTKVTVEDINAFLKRRTTGDELSVTGIDKLNSLIALENVKNRIKEIVATVKVQRNIGDSFKNSMHMMFSGAPGTGKTTVARILGRILKEEKLLSSGGYYEVSRKDLVGMYVGHTAPKTAEVCKMARGSILFIDEAYTLAGGSEQDFGKEAVGTLIAEMENYRDDFVVIFAGYDAELEKLFELNPGLRDRIPYRVHFDNYSRNELTRIFFKMLPEEFEHTEGFDAEVKEYFEKIPDSIIGNENFSNARYVRNLVERVISKASLRISMSDNQALKLDENDFKLASADSEFKTLNDSKKKKTIGF